MRFATRLLMRFAGRRTIRHRRFDRRIGIGFAEIIVAVAPSTAMPLAFGGRGVFTGSGNGRLRALLPACMWPALMAVTVAVVARPALFRSAAGPPDLDHF